MERKISSISITDEKVKVQFSEIAFNAGSSDSGDGEEDNDSANEVKYQVESKNKPHKNFKNCMTSLRKHALAICEITADSKELPQWDVRAIKIAGDVLMKKSRVVITLSKTVKSTGKECLLVCPQVTMYPDSEEKVKYHDADKLAVAIEDLLSEAEEYLAGKYSDEDAEQLPLFPGIAAEYPEVQRVAK